MPVSAKEWIVAAVERRRKAGNVPDRISDFAQDLHGAMVKAVERGEVKSAYKTSGAIEKYLRIGICGRSSADNARGHEQATNWPPRAEQDGAALLLLR